MPDSPVSTDTPDTSDAAETPDVPDTIEEPETTATPETPEVTEQEHAENAEKAPPVQNATETAATTEALNAAAGNGSPDAAAKPADPAAVPPIPAPRPKPPAMSNDEIIHDAFILGWQIVELRSRIQIARATPTEFNMQTASIWRSIINRITALQIKAFPGSSTENTLYEPPDKKGLPYLYPPSPDYGNIGIPGKDKEGASILAEFKLYEVTRRAINCLSLLYMKSKESLIPREVKENKAHLVNAILTAAKDIGSGGGEAQSEENTSEIDEGGEEANSESFPEPVTPLEKSIAILTERAVKFLEAWDGYLRENYYAGGLIPDDESELVAYEAGHSMSLLSWGISLATINNEKKVSAEDPDLKSKLLTSWKMVFRDSAVIRLQHQISALSTVLDDAYYKRLNLKRPDDDSALLVPNPDLPSQSIIAVKHSLDYWQRTIKWISELPTNERFRGQAADKDTSWSKDMRVALIEQTNIWQTLMTGQQSLRGFSLESITHTLMENVTVKIQQSLQSNFKGSLHQAEAAVKQIAGEVKSAIADAGDAALTGLEEMFKTYKRYLIPAGVIIGVVFVILVVIALISKDGNWVGATGGTGITGLIAAGLGYLGIGNAKQVKDSQAKTVIKGQETAANKVDNSTATAEKNQDAPAANAGHSLISRIEGAGNEAGKMVLDAINKGYKQIQIELNGLGQSAAVSYPLIEFFTVTFDVKGDEEFLTSIIWSGKERKEELSRILSAAFGSMALFINPSSKEDSAAPVVANTAGK